jgi:predicted Zn-dependent protease
MKRLSKLSLALAFAAPMALMPHASMTSPASGKKDFTPFMSSKAEKRIGAQEHPKLLAEFGGPYPDDKVSGYVAQVGGKMVLNSELPNETFTFTTLNSSIINAFALPGGYVYMSRQLLGLMNDEAELASVLGHETGHVTDRHSAKRYNRGIFAQILAVGAGIATGSAQVMQALGQASQAYTLSFSRAQEYKADELGIRYISRAGYDPFAAPDMLTSLGRQTSLDARIMGQDAEKVPNWARTHPLTEDRVAKANKRAQETGIAPGSKPRNRDQFLAAINGMVMDDSADQGFIRGRVFAHPKLKFTFSVPQGFVMRNTNEAVIAQGPNSAAALFSGGALQSGEPLANHVSRVFKGMVGQSAVQMGAVQNARIAGFDAAVSSSQVTTSNGTTLNLAIVAYRWSDTSAYHFVTLTPTQVASQLDPQLRAMIESFRRLSDAEAARFNERIIRVVTVAAGDSAASLSKQFAYDDNFNLERFLVLNRLASAADLKAGQRVKLIVERGS